MPSASSLMDLRRFLVLLLVMQYFQNTHWGLNDKVDPSFDKLSSSSSVHRVTQIDDNEKGLVNLTLTK
ncbi:hypothetical protein JVU11DRAFT_7836 [Chiua virens]|nr:hypothetical protein JVU11DRAFT_7836 [Chiua virens]